MKVYFVRHGLTNLRHEQRHQLPVTPLNEIGKQQAEQVADRFKTISVDKIFTSSHTRAQQTAEAINRVVKKELIVTDLLIERKLPTIFHGKFKDDPEIVKIKALIKEKSSDPDWRHSDEENFIDIKKRASIFLKDLEREDSQHLVVVSHGFFIGILILLMTFNELVSEEIYNLFIHTFQQSTTGLTFCEYADSKWVVHTWNDYAHLGEIYLSESTR